MVTVPPWTLIPPWYHPGSIVLFPFPDCLNPFLNTVIPAVSGTGRPISGSGCGWDPEFIVPVNDPPPGVDHPGVPATLYVGALTAPFPFAIIAVGSFELTMSGAPVRET